MLVFDLRNAGQSRATEVNVALLIYCEGNYFVPHAAYLPSIDPGDEPVQLHPDLAALPAKLLPEIFSGKLPLEVTVETTADSEWSRLYHTCSVFEFRTDSQRFVRSGGCRADQIEMQQRWGQLPKR